MSWIAVILMLIGLLFARKLFRDWLNPGVLFAASWFAGCLLVALVGNVTYGISIAAAFVFFGTVLLFNTGVLFVTGRQRFARSFIAPDWLQSPHLSAIISAGTILVVALTPLFFYEAVGDIGLSALSLRLVEIRAEQVDLSGTTGTFSLLNNLPVLVQALVMLAAFTLERHWKAWARLLLLLACWLLLGLSTGSKLVALQAPLTVLLCMSMSRNQMNWIGIVIAVISSVGIFSFGIIMINYGYLMPTGSTIDLDVLANLILSYFLGGLVGFSELLERGMYAYWPQHTLRTFFYTLNAISTALGRGDIVHIGYQHAPFISLGPNIEGNVYTAVFSYYASGEWLGVVLWPVLAGLLCGWAYRSFYSGRTWALVSAPVLFYGVLGAVYSEQIFGSFLVLLKLLIVFWGIRFAVGQARRIRKSVLPRGAN
jgi:oligosaccharide repeat unit polymerase